MNTAWFLERAGRLFPQSPAVYAGDAIHTRYGEFARRAASLGNALRTDLGLEPGARVAISMPNRPEFLEVLYGAWWAGCAVVPIDARLHPAEQSYILADSGAAVCFFGAGSATSPGDIGIGAGHVEIVDVTSRQFTTLLQHDEASVVTVAPTDLAWLFYTSGTTGRPKGAMLSHRNLSQMAHAYFVDIDTVTPADAIVHAAPLSHGSGLYHLPHVMKAARQVIPESQTFDPTETLDLIGHHPGASLFVAPTMLKRLVDASGSGSADASRLATIVYGGGPMYLKDCLTALDCFGPKLCQIYGQGESPMTITSLSKRDHADVAHPRYMERLGSVGTSRSVVQVAVGEPDRLLPPGELGEVLVRGDVVMAGYWQQPAATERTLEGGWLHTGDIGSFDSDGFLTLRDRSKDLVITGGNNVYPREVEEVLLTVPGVAEVAVVGRADPEWGETVVAFVVTSGSAPGEAQLDAACLAALARYKRPREYHFVAALPKNSYGKVLKKELRVSLASQEDGQGQQHP